ncbi:tyrosinase [Pseudozyma hubeiensis SY62]|uniref:Tyrosinase n=1 Tax=Pseudozyma hubeiensis (strain SY62) TaxID=1305764 RepID=R9PG88_PSEHS|nr:tyrosinase [Pseudozyma hubeiensis SY62]GAC97130.1 tyrosinase [Pseudozyma hubeiensis SY62]
MKCTYPVSRVSFYTLTVTERESWISSFAQLHTLRNKSIFVRGGTFIDDLAMVHIGLQEEMHYNACFLVCHTAFLRAFYSLMRVVGYRGREAYWDIESDWKGGMSNAHIWRYLGGDGVGGAIPSGPFKSLTCDVLPNTRKPGYSYIKPHFVTRHFNSNWLSHPLIRGDMYTSHYNSSFLPHTILSSPNYTALRKLLETSLHAWTHQSIAGEMWLYSSPCEPAFWLLHAEVDRCWRSWQSVNNKWYDYGGHRRIRHGEQTELKLASFDDEIDFYGLFEKVKVGDVMHPRKGILCFRYDKLLGGRLDTDP